MATTAHLLFSSTFHKSTNHWANRTISSFPHIHTRNHSLHLRFSSKSVPEPTAVSTDSSNSPNSLASAAAEDQQSKSVAAASAVEDAVLDKGFVTVAACVVGLLTGVGVVLFNVAVHEIRDISWDGIPLRGASWLREKPLEEIWQRVILVPACGGIIVGILNALRSSLAAVPSVGMESNIRDALGPILKTIAASVTLGTGNSLGPEGPSVEIGSSIAKGVGRVFKWRGGKKLPLVAAGSAAGIASGFNAAVAGCFFAVESVLWPSQADSFSSLSNSTPMIILSAVIAAVVSEIGLGSVPAFTVPDYDFRSASELPLYLLLGVFCGLISVSLTGCTSLAIEVVEYLQRNTRMPKAIFPTLGGLTVGVIALSYPEVLYWGFENVDILLESRPFVEGLPAAILFQLVGVKVFTTALSRASGLVGGYYAPSIFIGAAAGMAYGKFVRSTLCDPFPLFDLSILEVASPQAYGLVGMAATLAGVCQVPLTSVLLLFELTRDYRIVLPLLGAVGISSWISSSLYVKRSTGEKKDQLKVKDTTYAKPNVSDNQNKFVNSESSSDENGDSFDLCKLETSLCVYDASADIYSFAHRVTVSQAMRTNFLTVSMITPVVEAVSHMLSEKQSCAVIVDGCGLLVGLLSLEDIQKLCNQAREAGTEVDKILVSYICSLKGDNCKTWYAAPEMTLQDAEDIMDLHGVNHLPVVSEHTKEHKRGNLVGLLDKECINIALRAAAAQEYLGISSMTKKE